MLEAQENVYKQVLKITEKDDKPSLYLSRARFRHETGNWRGALSDYNLMIDEKPTSQAYQLRALVKQQLDDLEGALADLNEAELLDQDGDTTDQRVILLGLLSRSQEGLALAEEYGLVAEDQDVADATIAIAKGWAGQKQEGLDMLRKLALNAGSRSDVHNQLCWYGGTWNLVDEELLESCRKAVETSRNSLAGLDSRALAYFRLGRNKDAIFDLDNVLAARPGQHESRYLRGIIRLASGDKQGSEDMKEALAADPWLKRYYAAFGLGE